MSSSAAAKAKALQHDHYGVLEVHPRARPEVIRAAYLALRGLHKADARLAALVEAAYETLSDADRRAAYDAAPSKLEGTVIGGFRVTSKIADGGFGKTYRGEHVLTGSPVCIKHCSRISPESEAILIEEARAMWDLRHYGIPAVRDLLRLDDQSLALVMSFIEGPTLAQLVEKHGALDPEHVAWITERILNILKYLHYHGVVHGDLKPQNVIVQPESHLVTLVDFGLSAVKPTETTGSKGYTDFYSPPEQVDGSPLIPETDFYSLGMTMIYALSGKVDRVRAKEVPAKTPDALAEFIRRLIVRNPLDRPNWQKEEIDEAMVAVRKKAFGRARSGMKPLPK